MFSLNDRVVYPGHGVARITRIIPKMIGGKETLLYELKFINKDMTILVPIASTNTIRALIPREKIDDIFKFLAQPARKTILPDVPQPNWKQRNKDYQSKLRTGNLMDISSIYRELKHIELHKELSFCEKNLLVQTEMLLVEEIGLVQHIDEDTALAQLRALFRHVLIPATKVQQKVI